MGLEETVYPVDEEDGAMVEVCVVVTDGEIARDVVVNVASTDGTATCESTDTPQRFTTVPIYTSYNIKTAFLGLGVWWEGGTGQAFVQLRKTRVAG